MARVLKREAAKRDLIGQWVWYAESADIELADRFLSAVEKDAGAARHAAAKWSSQNRTARHAKFPVSDGFEKILLFYFPLKDGVDLVRVVRGSRDVERLVSEGFFA